MISNERQFIRLEEVEEKTNLTRGDILDAIDNGKLAFSALISTKSLGAVVVKDGKHIITAAFDYEGMVELTPKVSKQFAIGLEPQSVEHALILQMDGVTNWRSIPNAFGNFQQSSLGYTNTAASKPINAFWSYVGLETVATAENTIGSITNALSSFLPKDKLADFKKEHPDNNDQKLRSKPIRLEPQRLRINLKQVADAFGSELVNVSVQSTPQDISALPKSVASDVYTHPVQKVISNVLAKHSESSSREIWNIVRKDFESDVQQFDEDSLIFEMTNENLSYCSLGDTTKTISYRRFQNLISEVRKNLHG
ncbi:hypothetical protein [uncultured Vibrio sp.]|uniref:hypothetical protein n=1 Tax=uncultured Vibrio sp. TaxID=114054 RepID=UPI0009171307|nr:hypothetical protein [uncultured Vibrio sp.]OIQ24884.1 MAG: hypothetical protein BM561_08335 [Vibrio sp. MedPE-SWchi]